MSRLPTHQAKPISMVPKWCRPRLEQAKVNQIELIHLAHVDAIVRGIGTVDLLWDILESLLTWSDVAKRMDLGAPEIVAQIDLYQAVLDRYQRTGKVGYSGPEYQLAVKGTVHMTLLASEVDQLTALKAAEWAEQQVVQLKVQTDSAIAFLANQAKGTA